MLGVAERIALATALGLVVGLERFRAGKEAGIRTFALVAMAGCLSQLAGYPFYGLLVLVLTGVLIAASAAHSLLERDGPEVTTSAALIVTSLAGILAGQGQLFAAVSSIIVVLVLLAWKEEMAGFSQHLSREEVHAAIMLLLLGAVILPLLPTTPIDPWGLIDLQRTWIMVVLISGIGFVNYLLLRRYGARGITYTGFLGGLVNSTATVAEMARAVGTRGSLAADSAFVGITLAKIAMYVRNGIILALFAPAALPVGLLPIGLMLVVSASLAVMGWRRTAPEAPEVHLQSPFSLRVALEFGIYFLALTVFAGTAHRVLGHGTFYLVSFLGGMVSSASTTATAAVLARQGVLSAQAAGTGAVLASIGSVVALLPPLARASRGTALLRRAAQATVATMLAALIGLALNPWFLRWLPLLTHR